MTFDRKEHCLRNQKKATDAAAKKRNRKTKLEAESFGVTIEEYKKKKAKEASLKGNKRWRENNPEKAKERSRKGNKEWRDNNLERARELQRGYDANRRALKMNAKPIWAKDGYIKLFYRLARIEEKRIGGKVHVDHIVPLTHPRVCGLHCEDNLQLLTAKQNVTKRNFFDI